MVRALTFDLWHTLLHLAPEAEERYLHLHPEVVARVVAGWPRAPGPAPEFPLEGPELARQAFSLALAREKLGEGTALSLMAEDLARLSGRRSRPEQLIRALDRLVAELPFEETPGARRVLAHVTAQGYRVGVVSNLVGESGTAMRRVLSKLEMAPFIQGWALSEELKAAKPNPAIFEVVLSELGVKASDTVHIGDSPADIEGARNAGLRGSVLYLGGKDYGPTYARIHQPNRPIVPPPEHRLARWADLPALLPKLWPPDPQTAP